MAMLIMKWQYGSTLRWWEFHRLFCTLFLTIVFIQTKTAELLGHTERVLHLAISPDNTTVVSAGADETLRLWKCFIPDAIKKSMVQKNKSADQSALRGFIRWKIISSQDIIIVTYERLTFLIYTLFTRLVILVRKETPLQHTCWRESQLTF